MSSIVEGDVHRDYVHHVTHRDISHIYESYSFKVHKFYQRNAYCNKYHSVYIWVVYICWYDLFIYRVIRLLVRIGLMSHKLWPSWWSRLWNVRITWWWSRSSALSPHIFMATWNTMVILWSVLRVHVGRHLEDPQTIIVWTNWLKGVSV